MKKSSPNSSMITFLILLSISLRTINGYDKVSSFSCNGRAPGYYADINLDCKIYYLCNQHSFKTTFSCPERTAFEQRSMVCNHASIVDCKISEKYYDSNLRIGQQNSKLIEGEENGIFFDNPSLKYTSISKKPFKKFKNKFSFQRYSNKFKYHKSPFVVVKVLPRLYSQYQRPSKPSHQQLRHSYCRHKSTCKHRKLYKILRKSPKDGARGGSTSKIPRTFSPVKQLTVSVTSSSPKEEFFFTTTPSSKAKPWEIDDIRKIFYIPSNSVD